MESNPEAPIAQGARRADAESEIGSPCRAGPRGCSRLSWVAAGVTQSRRCCTKSWKTDELNSQSRVRARSARPQPSLGESGQIPCQTQADRSLINNSGGSSMGTVGRRPSRLRSGPCASRKFFEKGLDSFCGLLVGSRCWTPKQALESTTMTPEAKKLVVAQSEMLNPERAPHVAANPVENDDGIWEHDINTLGYSQTRRWRFVGPTRTRGCAGAPRYVAAHRAADGN